MQQAWHIFKKDIRYLRLEVMNYFASIVVAAWLAVYSASVTELLVAFTSAYLIAMLIHAEAPAGDRQFWITRPYRWGSLLGAKLLFLFAVIDLPVLLAQWFMLVHESFAFSAIWRGLLWEQFLLFFGVYLPLAALAALTSSLVQFLSFVLGGALIDIGISLGMYQPEHSLRGMEWIRYSLVLITLLLAAGVVVCLQYRGRHTVRNRLIAFFTLAAGAVAGIYLPWWLAFDIQKRFSTQTLDPSSVKVALDSSGKQWGLAMSRGKRVQMSLPFVVQGLPADAKAKPERLQITLQSSRGRDANVKSVTFNVPKVSSANSTDLILTGEGDLDRDFFDAERDHPVILRGSLFLTVFGNRQTRALYQHSPYKPVNVTDQLRCFIAEYGMVCDSPFRWPNQWVRVTAGASKQVSLYYARSYSPFPADLRFNPLTLEWSPPSVTGAAGRLPLNDVMIEVAEPVAYLRRDFEIRDLHLPDIAVPWQSRRVTRDGKSFLQNEY